MLTTDSENITFDPPNFSIPAHQEHAFEIIFRPLLADEKQSKITLKSPELGEYIFPLKLTGIAPGSIQRTMTLESTFGSDITKTFKFLNYCKKQTTYQCKVLPIGAKQPVQETKDKKGGDKVDFIAEPAAL